MNKYLPFVIAWVIGSLLFWLIVWSSQGFMEYMK